MMDDEEKSRIRAIERLKIQVHGKNLPEAIAEVPQATFHIRKDQTAF